MTQHKLPHGAWVFVGDGQKALFLINEGDGKFPNLRRLAVEEHKDPPSREQGSDAPGRAYSSVGEIRSAVEETDWHELEKERFAASIANRINKVALSAFTALISLPLTRTSLPCASASTRASNFNSPLIPKASPFRPRMTSVLGDSPRTVAFCGVDIVALKVTRPGLSALNLTMIT